MSTSIGMINIYCVLLKFGIFNTLILRELLKVRKGIWFLLKYDRIIFLYDRIIMDTQEHYYILSSTVGCSCAWFIVMQCPVYIVQSPVLWTKKCGLVWKPVRLEHLSISPRSSYKDV